MKKQIVFPLEELGVLKMTPDQLLVDIKGFGEETYDMSKVQSVTYTSEGFVIDIGKFPKAEIRRGPGRAQTPYGPGHGPNAYKENQGLNRRLLHQLKDGEKHMVKDLVEELHVAGEVPFVSIGRAVVSLTTRGLVEISRVRDPSGDFLKTYQITEKGKLALGRAFVEVKVDNP